MSPSLYDLLDVDPDASPAEIRAAWKAAIAELDPGDRRFRAYNQAAQTLLDPDRRAAYDAELVLQPDEDLDEDLEDDRDLDPVVDEDEDPVDPVDPEDDSALAEGPEADDHVSDDGEVAVGPVLDTDLDDSRAEDADADDSDDGDTEGDTVIDPAVEDPKDESDAGRGVVRPSRDPLSIWAVSLLSALAVAMLVLTVVVWTRAGASGDLSRSAEEQREARLSDAVAAAEKAVPVILSYDYQDLDKATADTAAYVTDAYAERRSKLYDAIAADVTAQQIVVEATTVGSGVVRSGSDRADVLVFLDQETTKAGASATPLNMWATLQMKLEDDAWLVDEIVINGLVAE